MRNFCKSSSFEKAGCETTSWRNLEEDTLRQQAGGLIQICPESYTKNSGEGETLPNMTLEQGRKISLPPERGPGYIFNFSLDSGIGNSLRMNQYDQSLQNMPWVELQFFTKSKVAKGFWGLFQRSIILKWCMCRSKILRLKHTLMVYFAKLSRVWLLWIIEIFSRIV